MRSARLHDVAVRAGVSKSTASRALNGIGELSESTRELVHRAAAELHYRPSPAARSLRTRRSETVGLIVPTISHSFYGAVTHGAQAVLDEAGYRLFLIDAGEDRESVARAVTTLVEHEVDGVLLSTARLSADELNTLLQGTPAVLLDEVTEGADAATVVLENAHGVRLLVEHMIGHGHRRIAYVGGPNDRTSGRERLLGFLDAIDDRVDPLVSEGAWTIASGIEQCSRLLAEPDPPTAIIIASAELGLGALAAARRNHVAVPDELALACFDDLYFAPLLQPALTAVTYDPHLIGRAGGRLLLDAIDGRPSRDERVDVSLVVRRSCGCEYDPATELVEVRA